MAALIVLLAPARAQDVPELLRRYVEQSTRVEYAGVQQISDFQTDGQRVTVQAFTHVRAGRERQKYDANPFYGGTIIGEQDGFRIVYVPQEQRLYRFPGVPTAEQRQAQTQRRLGFYEITLEGTTTVAGRRAYQLAMKPRRRPGDRRPAFGPSGTLWLDAEKLVRLGMQLRFGERVAHDARFTRIDYRPIQDAELGFDPPRGTTTVDMPAWPPMGGHGGNRRREGEPQRPPPPPPPPFQYASAAALTRATGLRVMVLKRVPDGFQLEGVAHHPPEADTVFRRRISARYTRGGQLVLLTMGTLFDGGPVAETPTEVKPKVFFWRRGPIRLALIGPRDVPSESLRVAAESCDWAE